MVQEGNNRYFKLLERLVWTGRGLKFSLPIDQENSRISGDFPIEIRDLALEREERIGDVDLFDISPLQIEVFVRKPEDSQPLFLAPLIQPFSFGISSRHGTHHVAQILKITTLPL